MIEVYQFDGKVERIELDKIGTRPVWICCQDISKEEAAMLKEKFNLHPLTAEDLFNQGVRIKIEEFDGYLFSIFYGITKKRDLVELDFVLGKNFLITNHRKELETTKSLRSDTERLEKLFKKGLPFLFHRTLDVEVDNYFPVLEKMDDEIEALEEDVSQNPRPEQLTRILEAKRQIVRIKKVAFQQREKISFLAKNDYDLLPKKVLPYFRDIYDHAIRVSDSLDNYREATANAFDVYMSAVSNNMNEVMKTLSIIATIALPLTVISGVYGTNFAVLPGQDIPYSFWIMVGVMILMAIAMLFYFRKKAWF